MTKRYTGGVISSSLPTVNAAGASGVFLLSQQADAQSRNSWPPFKIEESLRFRSSAGAYLNRTNSAAPANNKTYTISLWVKRGVITTTQTLFYAANSSAADYYGIVAFVSDNTLQFQDYTASTNGYLLTTQVFRDPAAWYHIVAAYDSTQATSSNRMKLYVNGVRITTFSTETYPAQNSVSSNNAANYVCRFGNFFQSPTTYYQYDGYMAEANFIDGQALTPSAFGATDKDGNWSPIAYTGTYGTNGFYVNFRDNTSATTMGYDYSGNGNNWTLNNFNVSTANTSYDIMFDVPSDQSDGTANNRGNYATFNPLEKGSNVTLSEGNLKYSTSSASGVNGIVSMRISTGMKSYFEFTCGSVSLYRNISIGGMTYTGDSGSISGGTGGTGTYATWTTGDVIRFACDYNAGTIACYKNATLQTTVTGITNTSDWVINAAQSTNTTGEYTANFGQRPFAYEPPSGFKALNTFNLPEPTIKQPNKHFDATTYTGTGSNTTITNAGSMEPGLVWIKSRSTAAWHILQDSLRGSGIIQFSNRSDYADQNKKGTQEVQFNSNGFSLIGSSPGVNDINESAATFVAWQWKSASSNTTNTTGSITTQVRANPTAGFSSFTFSGSASNGTIGHGLGAVPAMFIIKRRTNYSTTYDWYTYHKSIGNTKFLRLNTTGATTTFNLWQNTDPTSSVIYLTNDDGTNQSGQDYLGYAWAEIPGYSAFGSYTGNGSTDGPFIYTGFRPRFVMFKRTTSDDPWIIHDTARDIYNGYSVQLYPNASSAEGGPYSPPIIDELSNGFKCRSSASGTNGSGDTYIYMAFAEMPFKYSRSR